MSTVLHVISATAVIGASIAPGTYTTTTNGVAVDLAEGDGNGFVILSVGSLTEGATIDTVLQESADGSTWTAVAGVAFDTIDQENLTQLRRFQRSKRYLRTVVTLGGTTPEVDLVGLIGQQKKLL